MWNLSSLIRDQTCTLCTGSRSLNHWTTREVPDPGHLNWPNGQFKVWQMDFIQLPSSHGYKYVLVMVCVFSHWTEAFSWRRLPLLWLNSIRKKLSLPRKLLSNFIVIEG